MQISRRTPLAFLAALAMLALLLPAAPADASEVVKLARLVITGKRLSADHRELAGVASRSQPTTQQPTVQQLPPVLVEGQSVAAQNQAVQVAGHQRGQLRAL